MNTQFLHQSLEAVGGPLVLVASIVWLAAMISLPLRDIFGRAGARESAIRHAVVAQVLLVTVLSTRFLPPLAVVRVLIGVPLLGLLVEAIGTRTGFPFGVYRYTDRLQPQLLHVPLAIPAAWLMMMPPSWAVSAALTGTSSGFAFVVVSAAAFTAWDLLLDPRMVGWGYWIWERPGRYPGGIPFTNFVGWFLAAGFITALTAPHVPPPRAELSPVLLLVLVYGIVWALETLGQAFFWRMKASAALGGTVMGALSLAAFFAIRRVS
ncbi:MAG: carotenoid biosynthesis protein [Spirochaetaceae bacterium]|nr:MAG: carotenoid biosynthesis protein [Spirochaetaceae bacterium]